MSGHQDNNGDDHDTDQAQRWPRCALAHRPTARTTAAVASEWITILQMLMMP
jgi:hypothetical protein